MYTTTFLSILERISMTNYSFLEQSISELNRGQTDDEQWTWRNYMGSVITLFNYTDLSYRQEPKLFFSQ